jgi:hypothetical protein
MAAFVAVNRCQPTKFWWTTALYIFNALKVKDFSIKRRCAALAVVA